MDSESERLTGFRSVLSLAPAYRMAQRVIGAERLRSVVVDELIAATPDDRVLDVGCGTGDIVAHFPNVEDYVGFDPNPNYIQAARARFGGQARFVESTIEAFSDEHARARTVVITIGVLHHLDDESVRQVLDLAHRVLVPGGRFVSIDPTLTDDQHPIARLLVKNDRGRHVRTPAQVAELVEPRFPGATIITRGDLLRTPYTHVMVRASQQ